MLICALCKKQEGMMETLREDNKRLREALQDIYQEEIAVLRGDGVPEDKIGEVISRTMHIVKSALAGDGNA